MKRATAKTNIISLYAFAYCQKTHENDWAIAYPNEDLAPFSEEYRGIYQAFCVTLDHNDEGSKFAQKHFGPTARKAWENAWHNYHFDNPNYPNYAVPNKEKVLLRFPFAECEAAIPARFINSDPWKIKNETYYTVGLGGAVGRRFIGRSAQKAWEYAEKWTRTEAFYFNRNN